MSASVWSLRSVVFGVVVACSVAHAESACEKLTKLSSATVAITTAEVVKQGTFTPNERAKTIGRLPPFCRVAVTLKPTADSDIHAEVWLPLDGWNGKFLAVGSGGWGGSISYDGIADGLRRGYAASATDDGHHGGSASFVVGHPEKFVDFAYRAEHEMTVEAKVLIAAFYGHAPRYSYWNGCSGGGREGLLQAYRYPEEFDGVITGDPANIVRNSWALWLANQTFKERETYIPPSKYPMIHRAVLDACDANDGVKDGLISDPESCHVDFTALACKGEDGADCLTARQVKTAQTMIQPATTEKGVVIFPGLQPGTELEWGRLAGGPNPGDLFWDEFRYVVYQDPAWDWRSFELERDAAKAHAVDKDVDELNADLAAYAKHGGKLLMYHGWADQQVAPGSSVEFYKSAAADGADVTPASKWIRLYMVPGMGHCGGGEGPSEFDKIHVMEQWVEHGKAPEEIVASRHSEGGMNRTRPLCPYPMTVQYKGKGNADEAASFSCVAKQ